VDNIPLVDLGVQHRRIAGDLAAGLERLFATSAYILGPDVEAFESEYAAYAGVTHCVGVGNGTDALELPLRALDVGAGDEVILPANTYIATAEAVAATGARPVLVDCDEHHLIDPTKVKDAITPRTRAIMPVHLYGQAAAMEELTGLAEAAGAVVIEDAAQAQGARRHGRAAGSFGAAAGTSFYPGKNLGAYGDAGAVLTDDAALAARVRSLRAHGTRAGSKYVHVEPGMNSRLDTIQAVVLRAKLPHLDAWNAERRTAARTYDELLGDLEQVTLPRTLAGNEHVWYVYVVQVDDRDQVLATLRERGVGAQVHFPVPVHLQQAFAHLGHARGAFPVAEAAAERVLSLPLFPGITRAQQERVAAELRRAVGAAG
jgi:dTDP-4-amino-4,6-dideoxygalactose transaminase